MAGDPLKSRDDLVAYGATIMLEVLLEAMTEGYTACQTHEIWLDVTGVVGHETASYQRFSEAGLASIVHRLTQAGAAGAPPEWVTNDNGELGVKVNGRYYFLYKGDSLEYDGGRHDDGTPTLVRPVGKYEFGETCRAVHSVRGEGWQLLPGRPDSSSVRSD